VNWGGKESKKNRIIFGPLRDHMGGEFQDHRREETAKPPELDRTKMIGAIIIWREKRLVGGERPLESIEEILLASRGGSSVESFAAKKSVEKGGLRVTTVLHRKKGSPETTHARTIHSPREGGNFRNGLPGLDAGNSVGRATNGEA